MIPPPPPPPPPGNGCGPPPPPPPGAPCLTGSFKIVPGLGDALHEMKRKISGLEETPACAEGTASEDNRTTSTPTGTSRPKSWHGSQVPGKPAINRAIISEMQSKLAKRRDKVDKEAYVVETPESALPPTGQKPRPVSGTEGNRKSSTPLSRGWTPPVDYGPRGVSKDSGRDSWTPTSDYDPQRKVSVDYSQYRKVSVDLERKEELSLAKAVRKSSVKMLGRGSPSIFEQNVEAVIQPTKETPPPQTNVPPPSPVVMRYCWKQCSSTADDTIDTIDTENENDDDDKNGQSVEPAWKTDALEGEVTQFPSIKNKIANMEEEAKTKMFVVPDVKSKMRQGAPAAGWMEARSKLQHQLDSLITKTSAKMTKFGNVHAIEPKEFAKDSSNESETFCDAKSEREELPKAHKLAINSNIKSLIKCVANEIQKSFSAKNIPVLGDDDDDKINDENNNKDINTDPIEPETGEYWRNLNNAIRTHPQNIDMEPPLDFDYNEPVQEDVKETAKEDAKEELQNIIPTDTSIEEPVGFDSTPIVLDASVAKSKATLMRKSSTERRLPASVLAKKKAAEKLKDILNINTKDKSGTEKPNVIEQIKKELIDASLQVDMSNTEYDLENLDDEQKADLIAKQISKMDSSYVMKLLKQIEKGILDISIPMLMPFLSLQVRMKLGTNIFKGLEPHNKKKVVKENFINDMIEDITDIALLQEVIERTQEKLNILCPPKEVEKEIIFKNNDNYFNIENDSFDLPSAPARHTSPVRVESPVSAKSAEPDETHDSLIAEEKEKSPEVLAKYENPEIIEETQIKPEVKTLESETDAKKSDDEGCPSSECDSSSDEDKEDSKDLKESVTVEADKTDEDEGLGKEQETGTKEEKEEKEPKEGKEKVIKQRILNIIENAKTIDQKRSVRNFGRTFEFQNMQLKPILPNDKRPAKAKRMDNMWNQITASKQNVQINHEPSVPKPKVPWTMKKNPQPQKKTEDKDVEEFDKCRDTLKNSSGKPTPSLGKDIKTTQHVTISATNNKKKESIAEETKESIKIEDIQETPKTITTEKINCKETSVTTKILTEVTKEEKDTVVIKEKHLNAELLKTNKVECKEVTETRVPKPVENRTFPRKNVSTDVSRDQSNSEKPKDDSAIEDEWEPSDEVKIQKENVVPKNIDISSPKETIIEEHKEEDKEVPSTPIVRRRGDTFTVVLPPPKCKPPPPPMSRPPPPPLSPPVPVSKVKDLEKENKLVIEVKNKDTELKIESEEEDEEEEEESEWEWTESEEESEEESECEVKKEGWENIMSSSSGPTTFKAEYCLKLGGN
eukprot:GFUD01013013.1.p1 GENE.GFUD01013013.1~~GFUD01013013.1.p1  ORF type:complete len:1302 (+),score=446.81 GFUD01013013.1:135-4040(+)